MTKTRCMTSNQNHDNDTSSSSIRVIKTRDNGVAAPWSDLDHNVLFLVMMQLRVVDFISFGGVCKLWRSLAVSNRNMFMASKPPMSITRIVCRAHNKVCYLEDFKGRKFKTILHHFAYGACVGLTCGYLIFFTKTTRAFWLVNPITRHELHFPNFHVNYCPILSELGRAILVFSCSMCGWVFVVLFGDTQARELWFSIAGQGAWNQVSYDFDIIDLYAFMGTIYTLSRNIPYRLGELRINPEPKLTLLETKNFPSFIGYPVEFVSSGEKLYVMDRVIQHPKGLYELDFEEMKWMSSEKIMGEYAFFRSELNRCVAVKQEPWADPRPQYERYGNGYKGGKNRFFTMKMWYFPHECLNVDLID